MEFPSYRIIVEIRLHGILGGFRDNILHPYALK